MQTVRLLLGANSPLLLESIWASFLIIVEISVADDGLVEQRKLKENVRMRYTDVARAPRIAHSDVSISTLRSDTPQVPRQTRLVRKARRPSRESL